MGKRAKVVDKWKTKKWFKVEAPGLFESAELCELVSGDEKNLGNRIVRVNLGQLTSSRSQIAAFTNVNFRINEVGSTIAKAKLIGHQILPSFLKTFARRGKALGHYVVDVKTKDGENIRLKAVAVATGRISATTRKNLGKAIVEEIKKTSEPLTYDELMREILWERFTPKIFGKIKKITSMRRFEIRKSELKEVFN